MLRVRRRGQPGTRGKQAKPDSGVPHPQRKLSRIFEAVRDDIDLITEHLEALAPHAAVAAGAILALLPAGIGQDLPAWLLSAADTINAIAAVLP